jgi:signal transduction histidine kinase
MNTRSLLRTDQPAPALTAALGTLDRIGSQMTTILDDLLLLTRLDAGRVDPASNQSSVAITEVFDELAILHEGEAEEEQQIALIFTVTTPMTLQIAPARLQRTRAEPGRLSLLRA